MKMLQSLVRPLTFACTMATFAVSNLALAYSDDTHHVRFPLGFRAVGLSGAYTAVAADSSALIYNPAGLAFTPFKSRSSSLHAVMNLNAKFDNILEDNDIEFRGTNYPWYVGGLKNLKGDWSRWTMAVAAYAETQLENEQSYEMSASLPVTGTNQRADYLMSTLSRNSSKELNVAIGAGTRISTNLTVGFAIGGFENRESEYTDSINEFGPIEYPYGTSTISSIDKNYQYAVKKSYNRGVDLRLGTLYRATDNLDLGATVQASRYLRQAGSSIERDVRTQSSKAVGTPDPSLPAPGDNFRENSAWDKIDNPYGQLPVHARVGSALKFSDTVLWTLDVLYASAVSRGELYDNRSLKHVVNYATGLEVIAAPHFPIRMGLFTNFDASPDASRDPESDNQQHIDFYGMSIFAAWEDGDWALTLGGLLERGDGETRTIVGDEVEFSDITFRLWSAVGGIASSI